MSADDEVPQGPLALARGEIDAIDDEIVRLLARRDAVVSTLWAWKAATGRPLRDPAREAGTLARVRALARAADLDPDRIEAVFRAVVGRRLG